MPEVVPVRQKDILGRRGEQVAADHLEEQGFRILDRNYRCQEGELDIVAAEHRTLVAVEVKTRSGLGFGTPLEAVTPRKRRRLRHLAVTWVVSHGILFDDLRVDVVEVMKSPDGEFTVELHRGIG